AGRIGAADQARGGRARPILPDALAGQRGERRMPGQPEVVVAAEVQQFAPIEQVAPRRSPLEHPDRTAQVKPLRFAQAVLEKRVEWVCRHAGYLLVENQWRGDNIKMIKINRF